MCRKRRAEAEDAGALEERWVPDGGGGTLEAAGALLENGPLEAAAAEPTLGQRLEALQMQARAVCLPLLHVPAATHRPSSMGHNRHRLLRKAWAAASTRKDLF